MKKDIRKMIGGVVVIIISIMTFVFWKTANKGIDDLLDSMGINNFYVKSAIIIVIGILLIILIKIFFLKRLSIIKTVKDIAKL